MFRQNFGRAFTIVELLIVIVVIGILAAIIIVSYIGITNQAYDTAVKSDLSTIAKKLDLYTVQFGASLPIGDLNLNANLVVGVNRAAEDTSGYYAVWICRGPTTDSTAFTVLAISKTGNKFMTDNSTSVIQYTGAAAWTDSTAGSTLCGAINSSTPSWAATGYDNTLSPPDPWRVWAGGTHNT